MKYSKSFFRLLAISVLLLISYSVLAQNPYIKNYSKDEYHAEHKNWSISQDEQGILYVGNDGGLMEFDGVNWDSYKLPKNQVVRSVFAVSNTTIYTGGFEEIGRWDRGIDGKLTYTSLSDSLKIDSFHNDDIWRIWQLEDKLYFQSFRSVYIYDGKMVKTLSSKAVLFLNKVYEELWIQEIGGDIYKLVNDVYQKVPGSETISNTNVQIILPYGDNEYLIGTSSRGIFRYDGTQFTEWYTEPNFANDIPNCAVRLKNGNYYFGTIRNGIYVLSSDGKLIDHLNTDTYLQNNTVLALHTDLYDNVWAGLDKGISCIKPQEGMKHYVDRSNRVGAMYAAATYAGKLFVGTNQGVYYMDVADMNSISDISQLKFLKGTQGQVWDLNVVRGKLYCGHNEGLKVISPDLSVSSPYGITTGVFSIVEGKNDNLLVGTYVSLVSINLKDNKVLTYDKINEPVRKIVLDDFGNIWLEHMNKGVYKCQLNDAKTEIISVSYFGKEESNSLPYEIYLFQVGGRVAFLGNDMFYTYDDNSNLITPYQPLNLGIKGKKGLRNAINIDKNNFWLIGENVIYKMSYNGTESKIVAMVDVGTNNMTLVNSFENIVSLNDTTSFVCLDNGFLLYNNDLKTEATTLRQPYIKSIATKNLTQSDVKYYSSGQFIEIPQSYNTIEVSFASQDALEYDLLFQYKLEGLAEWSSPERINSISFERLPIGEHVLHIRSVDRSGNISVPVSCQIEILPPWYLTSWAYILYGVILLAIGILVWKLTELRYRKIYLEKERKHEMERLKIDKEQLTDLVEIKTAELLTQTSSIIQRNELIHNIKAEIDGFYEQGNKKILAPLRQRLNILLNSSVNSEEDWKMFLIKFEEKHTNFFKNLKASFPDLTANDLKLCACLKLNLDSKEIASLMNISIRSVENNRYRLRKKLNISADQSLSGYFVNL